MTLHGTRYCFGVPLPIHWAALGLVASACLVACDGESPAGPSADDSPGEHAAEHAGEPRDAPQPEVMPSPREAEMPAADGWVPPDRARVAGVTCALDAEGGLTCDGTPVQAGVLEIIVSADRLCARTTDGSAFCGSATPGAPVSLQRVEGAVGVRQMAASSQRVCLLGNDRRVRCASPGERARRVAQLEGAVELTSDRGAFYARTRDGHVARWSADDAGRSPAAPLTPPVSNARAITARGARLCMVTGDDARLHCRVSAAPSAEEGAASAVPPELELTGVQQVGLMDEGGCAVRGDAELVCWGRVPQSDRRTGPTSVGEVGAGRLRCGAEHCCVLASTGSSCVGRAPGAPSDPSEAEGWVITNRPSTAAGVEPPAGP